MRLQTTLKKALLAAATLAFALGVSSTALAAPSVTWLTPPDGTSFPAGTIVNPTGQANGGFNPGTGLDLALVIDVSGSMGWNASGSDTNAPVGSRRIDVAIPAAIALVNSLPVGTTSVSVIAFNSSANTVQTLTSLNPNKAAVIAAINSLSPGGGTTIGTGIDAATTDILANGDATRAQMMVVLSDGQSSGNPAASAANALANGIQVHSVAIPNANVAQMQAIATAGGGTFTNVTNLDDLIAIFDGTGGNLVGIDHVDIELPDGTVITVPTDGLGNFVVPDWVMELGPNEFIATVYADDGGTASAKLTLIGTNPIPEPSAALLFGAGALVFGGRVRSRRG